MRYDKRVPTGLTRGVNVGADVCKQLLTFLLGMEERLRRAVLSNVWCACLHLSHIPCIAAPRGWRLFLWFVASLPLFRQLTCVRDNAGVTRRRDILKRRRGSALPQNKQACA